MVHEPVIQPVLYPGVTVSSTFRDLEKHRLALLAAIGQSSLKPVCMEDDAAKLEDVIDSSLQKVRDGSAYIGIIAHRYGQTPECPRRNPDRLSITELEFNEAQRLNRPILLFIMADDHPVVKADVESDPDKQRQLDAFRERAKEMGAGSKVHRVYAVFHSVEDFRDKATRSLRELYALLRPAVASTAVAAADGPPPIPVPPRRYAVPPYIGSHEFQGRADELATLDDWSAPADPHPVLLFEAIGGTGKSMLTWHWVTQNVPALRDDWAGVFWYSFYERGAVLADFCGHALAYMTQAPLDSFRAVPMPELADRLLRQLQARPWLLVLDGLERVLVAYHRHDAAQLPDQEAGTGDAIGHRDPCQAIRPDDDDLLRRLATAAPSKLLLTTRLTPKVLLNAARMPVPGVRRVLLPGLRPGDAEKLLRACGVSGTSQKIQDYLQRHCDCHPLVTGVIAGLVNDYLPARGDLDAWAGDPSGGGQLDLASLNLSQKRNHILYAALDALPAPGRQLLSTLALVSEALDYETLRALSPHRSRSEEEAALMPAWRRLKGDRPAGRPEESLATAQALAATVLDLERRGLLQYDHQDKRYDLHPVVRGIAAGRLASQDRQVLGQRVVDHFSQRPHSPYHEARSLEDVSAGLQVVRTLLQMGRYEQAFNAYNDGLGHAIKFNLDADCEVLALLRPFFGLGWTDLPTGLAAWGVSWLAGEAAQALYQTRQIEDSLAVHRAALLLDVDQNDLWGVVTNLQGIGYVLYSQHKLALVSRCSDLGLQLGNLSHDDLVIFKIRLLTFLALATRGEWEGADAEWQVLGLIRSKTRISEAEINVAEYFYLTSELWRGRLEESELRRAEERATASRDRRFLARLYRIRGAWKASQDDWQAAVRSLNEAVRMMREVGARNWEWEARLALAKFRLGQLPEPRQQAEELSQVNDPAHSVLAELWLALGDDDRARHHALAAYREAWADGVPHVSLHALEKARALLERLGVEVPVLPGYDPSKAEKLPFEDVVVAYIEKLRAERAAENPDARD
jgi:tetratricopeptide (TPR) repeat protein